MRNYRKIAIFTIFIMVIMKFSTINVKALEDGNNNDIKYSVVEEEAMDIGTNSISNSVNLLNEKEIEVINEEYEVNEDDEIIDEDNETIDEDDDSNKESEAVEKKADLNKNNDELPNENEENINIDDTNVFNDVYSEEHNNTNSASEILYAIESPIAQADVKSNSLKVSGWAINESGISEIRVYLNNNYLGTAEYGFNRTDINNLYPDLSQSTNSGFCQTFDISKYGNGTKEVKIEIVANNGSYITENININVQLISLSELETPKKEASITNSTLKIKGWALADSGVKYVNVYMDGEKIARATYGIARSDIQSKYPQYVDSKNAGFEATIDISKIKAGTKKIEIVVRANDNSKQVITININVKLKSVSKLETPKADAVVKNSTLSIKGWALAESGIKYVNVYMDGEKIARANYGKARSDIQSKYPQYIDSKNVGFEATIDISKIKAGTKKIEIVVRANDNSKQVITININVKLKSVSKLETPKANATIKNGKLILKGWALAESGVNYVNVYIDGQKVGRATYGKSRSDVKSLYPQYVDSKKPGFEANIDLSKLETGIKKLEVVVRAKDGTKQVIEKSIKITSNLPARSVVDTPSVNEIINAKKLSISGWALHSSGIDYINVYIDGKKVGKLTYGNDRPDVQKAYPGYSAGKKCGFKGTIDISKLSKGNKKLEILVRAKDGTKQVIARNITIASGKTVYIDPGHDYGGDQGAFATHGSITYSETEINIDIAEKLRTELINMGYNVVMARRKGERPTSPDYRTNLWNRINAANDMKADFYVSIHNNMSGSSSTTGTEVYYSSDNPNKLSASALNSKVTASKSAATKVSQGVASALGTNNRGAKDDSFMVVRYTNMPAILVECGFMSNAAEVKKLTTASYQTKIAKAIADGIKATIN